ncbi:hypothetical protein [Xanthomonas campestris]|uniref:hypothetical protein n=1 Tax=Xanthomonas campestris TaxID=339 RepID=UPI00138FCD4F|nr:hypothetical protein [Xanthomonas campestris]
MQNQIYSNSNSNSNSDSDSDSDSDSENRTRHVSLRRYIRSAGLFEHEHLSPGVSNHVWLLSTSPTRRMQIKPTVSAGESPSGALRHSIVRLDPRVTAELIS